MVPKASMAVVLLLAGALLAPVATVQDQPKPAKPPETAKPAEAVKPALSVEDAAVLIAVIRSRSTPDLPPPTVPKRAGSSRG